MNACIVTGLVLVIGVLSGYATPIDDLADAAERFSKMPIGFTLKIKAGENDYANCAGTYIRFPPADSPGTRMYLRKKPIYFCEEKNRIAFYTGTNWVITNANYLRVVMGGAKGGFFGTKAGTLPFNPSIWADRYEMTVVQSS